MDKQIAQFLPLILLFAVFYFFLIRPQQQADKKRREMLAALKKGDRVVTAGGIYGTIAEIYDDRLRVRIADKVEVDMAKTGVVGVRE